ncbi:MAG: GTP cyclohydrolase I FolE2 [Pirellulales bacterium]|nr:GTP cyclohydrolase I FolE2 [Pirellulales bacterium]
MTDLRYPILVLDRQQEQQQTTATLTMSVGLPHQFKGTHMSRFVEVLAAHRGELTMRTLPAILRELKQRLDAETARVEVSFDYFLERTAPVSGAKALMGYPCSFIGEANGSADDFVLIVDVPVTSLCPCSKAISHYVAHNQRANVEIQVRSERDGEGKPRLIWIEELIDVAEQSASSPVYPVLKRSDERHVTMQAYERPVFVEDLARNVAVRLQADPRVKWFRVRALNQESIHSHNAYAVIQWARPV